MNLPTPPIRYLQSTEATRNRLLLQADGENLKRDRDADVGKGRLILTAPDGSRHALVVDNAGVLSTVAV